ncbi:MAG TPA: hypothetical protein VHZ03_17045 [Trebonia sp.]|jgi:hypothetical protein|nr:hypothetical protein [Trebonia sp.]
MTMTIEQAGLMLADPLAYTDETRLLPRLESIDLAGTPEWTATTFVGGLKHLPVRCTFR